jgi:hypothetical protein
VRTRLTAATRSHAQTVAFQRLRSPEGTLFRQGFGAGVLSGGVPFYKPTEAGNRSADLFGRSAAFCCAVHSRTMPCGSKRNPSAACAGGGENPWT